MTPVIDFLSTIRRPTVKRYTGWQRVITAVLILLGGAVLGLAAKMLDGTAFLGNVGSMLGIWVFAATLVAVYSPGPFTGGAHCLLFFAGLLLSYYSYQFFVLHFISMRVALTWGIFALLSPVAGFVAWFSKGGHPVSCLVASLPIALLLTEGYPALYTGSPVLIMSLVFALVLAYLLPKTWKQRGIVLFLALCIAFFVDRISLLSRLFGGL